MRHRQATAIFDQIERLLHRQRHRLEQQPDHRRIGVHQALQLALPDSDQPAITAGNRIHRPRKFAHERQFAKCIARANQRKQSQPAINAIAPDLHRSRFDKPEFLCLVAALLDDLAPGKIPHLPPREQIAADSLGQRFHETGSGDWCGRVHKQYRK